MTALSASRDAKRHSGVEFSRTVLSGNQIWKGAAVGLNTAGTVQSAAKAVSGGLQIMGVALESVLGDGTQKVNILAGCFEFQNSAGGDAIASTDSGKLCYFDDDQTVAIASTGSRPVAGRILGLADTGKVIVKIGPDISFADAT